MSVTTTHEIALAAPTPIVRSRSELATLIKQTENQIAAWQRRLGEIDRKLGHLNESIDQMSAMRDDDDLISNLLRQDTERHKDLSDERIRICQTDLASAHRWLQQLKLELRRAPMPEVITPAAPVVRAPVKQKPFRPVNSMGTRSSQVEQPRKEPAPTASTAVLLTNAQRDQALKHLCEQYQFVCNRPVDGEVGSNRIAGATFMSTPHVDVSTITFDGIRAALFRTSRQKKEDRKVFPLTKTLSVWIMVGRGIERELERECAGKATPLFHQLFGMKMPEAPAVVPTAPTVPPAAKEFSVKAAVDQFLRVIVVQSDRDVIGRVAIDQLGKMFFPIAPNGDVAYDAWIKDVPFSALMACVFHSKTRKQDGKALEKVRLPHDVLIDWINVNRKQRIADIVAWIEARPPVAISMPSEKEIENVRREARREEDKRLADQAKEEQEKRDAAKAAKGAAKAAAGKSGKGKGGK